MLQGLSLSMLWTTTGFLIGPCAQRKISSFLVNPLCNNGILATPTRSIRVLQHEHSFVKGWGNSIPLTNIAHVSCHVLLSSVWFSIIGVNNSPV